jgi:hypothetical protein
MRRSRNEKDKIAAKIEIYNWRKKGAWFRILI